MPPPPRHKRDHVYCEACHADLGKMRPAAGGGVYLDGAAAAHGFWRNPEEPGCFMLVCRCGHETTWRGEAVTSRRRLAA